jgi:predicted RNA-binding protein with RPS1 domain
VRLEKIKIFAIILLILILSSSFEFPFHLQRAFAQAVEEASKSSKLSFQENNAQQFNKEGVFYCSTPRRLNNGKYEYFLVISNPNKKKISLFLWKYMQPSPHPADISYWEPLTPEKNVKAEGPKLISDDEIVFRAFQSDTPGNLGVVQDGGDSISIVQFDDCEIFLKSMALGVAITIDKTLDSRGYYNSRDELTNKIAFLALPALVNIISQQESSIPKYVWESRPAHIFGDSGFDPSQGFLLVPRGNIPNVKELLGPILAEEYLNTYKPVVIFVGDLVEKHTWTGPYLTESEIRGALEVFNLLRKYSLNYETGEGYVVAVSGNNDLIYLLAVKTRSNLGLGGTVASFPEFARLSPGSEYFTLANNLANEIADLPLVAKVGNKLIVHTPEVLDLLPKYNLKLEDVINRPTKDVIKMLGLDLDEIDKMSPAELNEKLSRVTQFLNEMTNNRPTVEGIQDIIRRNSREIIEVMSEDERVRDVKSIEIIFGHTKEWANTPDVDRKYGCGGLGCDLYEDKESGIIIRGKGVWKKLDETSNVPGKKIEVKVLQVDEEGNQKEVSVKEAAEKVEKDTEQLKPKVETANQLSSDIETLFPHVENLDVLEGLRGELSQNFQKFEETIARLEIEGKLKKEDAQALRSALASMKKAVDEFDIKSYEGGREEMKSIINKIKQENHVEAGRVLTNAVSLIGTGRKEVSIAFLEYLRNNLPTTLEEVQSKVPQLKNAIEGMYSGGYIDESIRDALLEAMKAIESSEDNAELVVNTYRARVTIHNAESGMKEGRGIYRHDVNFVLSTFLEPTLKAINIKLEESQNLGIFTKLSLSLAKKIVEFPMKHPKIYKAMGSVLAVWAYVQLVLPYVRDYYSDNPTVLSILDGISSAMNIIAFISTSLYLGPSIIGLIIGTVSFSEFGTVILSLILSNLQWMAIALVVTIVAILVYCSIINPQGAFCLCDFGNAKYALVRRGTQVSERSYTKTLDATVALGEEYDLLIKDVSGKGCKGAEYVVKIGYLDPFYAYVFAESSKPIVMMCDSNGKCGGFTGIKIPPDKGRHDYYNIYLVPPGGIERIIDPRKWENIIIGKITISSSSSPQPSSPSQPSQPTVRLTLSSLTCNSNERKCTLQYINEETESFNVRFYLIKDGKVVEIDEKPIPAAQAAGSKNSGSIQTKTFGCPAGAGTYNVMFQVFKSSDSKLVNPIYSPLQVGGIRC